MPENGTPDGAPAVTSPTKEFNLIDEHYPPGIPLSAKYKKGFGFTTINQRLPVIVTKIIDQLSRDKNELEEVYGPETKDEIKLIVGALAKLKNEMVTNKPVTRINNQPYDSYLKYIARQYFGGNEEEVKWYTAPWLHVECYFYKRIDEAFKLTQLLKDFDPFKKQKEEGFLNSVKGALLLGDFVLNAESSDKVLQTLLEVCLWGNRCDLSLSAGKEVSQTGNLVDQLQDLRQYILCDDSANLWKVLSEAKRDPDNPVTIGYVLDNSGFELFTDLCFTDKLMERVDRVDFYVKTTPWFISDVMAPDFHWMLDRMSTYTEEPTLVKLADRWKGYVSSGRWRVVKFDFWTYPHAFHEMKMKDADPELYSTLAKHTHLIFKGDLNYRKLIGDWSWPPETPFKDALRGFCPCPLLTLRTLKADCVAGLKKGVAEEVESKSSDWCVTGEYGILQHAQ